MDVNADGVAQHCAQACSDHHEPYPPQALVPSHVGCLISSFLLRDVFVQHLSQPVAAVPFVDPLLLFAQDVEVRKASIGFVVSVQRKAFTAQ